MKTKTILIVAICVVCAATLMSGCIDVDDPYTDEARFGAADVREDLASAGTLEIGTYENPTPLGEILTSSTGALDIGIIVIRRGEDVNYMAQRENMFNDEPGRGNEYMLVGIVVAYKEMSHLDNDEKFSLSSYDFDAYANNIECNSPFLVLPDEFDTSLSTYMMPGGVSTVWAIFEVPKESRVTIAYDRTFVRDVYYFDAGIGDFD